MVVEQIKKEGVDLKRREELDQLIKEMAAHFCIQQDTDKQAHFRSWRHALEGHVNRYRGYYYED